MKQVKVLNLLVTTMLIAITAVGCKKNPKNITPIQGRENAGLAGPGAGAPIQPRTSNNAQPITFGGPSTSALQPSTLSPSDIAAPPENASEDREALSQQAVYFEFDRSAIRVSEQSKLAEVATYLKNNPAKMLRVEGNCDERGTEEYNRALGERRAIAAREFLIQRHQIDPGRITTVSYGEDRPADPAKDEAAYAKNRRDEFVILNVQ